MPPAVHALRTLADWWSQSELFSSGPARERAIKLWLQLAEQARGVGDSSMQFATIVDTVVRTVRADVLAALQGRQSLDSVPWFSTLQQCPNMSSYILFNLDEYNKWVSNDSALKRLAKLPLMLSDVMMASESTMRMFRAAAASLDSEIKYAAVPAIVVNESVGVLDWAQRCLDSIGVDVGCDGEQWVKAADSFLVANPALLSRPSVAAGIRRDGKYSLGLWRLVCARQDLFPWALPACLNSESGSERQRAADEIVIANPFLLSCEEIAHVICQDGPYSAALWQLICAREDLFPWAKMVRVPLETCVVVVVRLRVFGTAAVSSRRVREEDRAAGRLQSRPCDFT